MGATSVVDTALEVIAALLPPISHQLKFHPFEVEYTLMVCVPAAIEMFALTVCQFCHPPVFGILTVASTAPATVPYLKLSSGWSCYP